jgi:hypothetical protein
VDTSNSDFTAIRGERRKRSSMAEERELQPTRIAPRCLTLLDSMKTIFVTGVMTLMAAVERVETGIASGACANAWDAAQAISIHGAKFVGDYTGALSLNKWRHWFAQAEVRGTLGNVAYNG